MKTFFPGPHNQNARQSMRSVGYGEHVGRGGQLSYTRRLSTHMYPRYHAYVEDLRGGIQVNLHLDQKEASYSSGHAHGGEYDGPLVEREMAMISQHLAPTIQTPPQTGSVPSKKGEAPASIQRPPMNPTPNRPSKKGGLWD